MTKIGKFMKDADSRRAGGCSKPECKAKGIPHRHHVRHEAIWLGIWAGRRAKEPKWKAFVKRYHAFVHKDYIVLCPDHHAEIHMHYDAAISDDLLITGRHLSAYSWAQAETLMNRLAAVCAVWLKTPSPGIDSVYFGKTREARKPREPKRRSGVLRSGGTR